MQGPANRTVAITSGYRTTHRHAGGSGGHDSSKQSGYACRRRDSKFGLHQLGVPLKGAHGITAVAFGEVRRDERRMSRIAQRFRGDRYARSLDRLRVPSSICERKAQPLERMDPQLTNPFSFEHHPLVVPFRQQVFGEEDRVGRCHRWWIRARSGEFRRLIEVDSHPRWDANHVRADFEEGGLDASYPPKRGTEARLGAVLGEFRPQPTDKSFAALLAMTQGQQREDAFSLVREGNQAIA